MIPLRRISEKKCRFTAKKITYLEYQRVKRLELTKNITERKRMTSTLFLPEGVEEPNSLSHEAVQRILNRGSLFHTVKVFNNSLDNNSLSNIDENYFSTLNTIKEEDVKDNLEFLMYGRLFKSRCMSNHDLCLLLSYLLRVAEVSGSPNFSLLLRTLENVNLNLKTFSVSELSQVMYNITEIWRLVNSSKPFCNIKFNPYFKEFIDLSHKIMNKSIGLLFVGGDLNNVNFVSSSNISKIIYSISNYRLWNAPSLRDKMLEMVDLYIKYLKVDGKSSKDFVLMLRSMVLLNFPNYELMFIMGDFYHNLLVNLNFNLVNELKENSDEFVNINHIFEFFEASELFGVNHKGFLDELNRYFNLYISSVLKNPKVYKLYRENTKTKNFSGIGNLFQLLRDDKCFKNRRLNLKEIVSRISPERNQVWDDEVIKKVNKYVNNRKMFKEFVSAMEIDLFPLGTSEKRFEAPEDLDTKDLIELFIKSSEYLPKVVNFKFVWKVVKVINLERKTDLIPVLYSYLQESSLIFEDLDGPSEDLCGIFDHLMGTDLDEIREETGSKKENNVDLVVIDNICKIVQMISETDLKRDHVCLGIFSNLFNILYIIKRINKKKFQEMDQCGSLSSLEGILKKYFENYKNFKVLEFEEIPKPKELKRIFKFLPKLDEKLSLERMVSILEDFGEIGNEFKELINLNRDVFRFIIYNGFMAEIQDHGL